MSLWESLLDDINALKNKKPPSDDDAPRMRSLLRQVNELAGAARPADREGNEHDDGAKDVQRDVGARTKGNVADEPLVVNFQESRKGLVLPPGVPVPEDGRRIADEGLPTLMNILGKGEGKTEEDRATLAGLGDRLLRLSKSDPEAFKRFDPKLREFTTIFGRNWEYRQNRLVNLPRGDVKYHTPDKVEVSRRAWDGAMREAAASAADEVFVAPAKRKAVLKGIADVPGYLGKGVDLFGGLEGVRAATDRYEKLVEAHLGRSEEFRNLKPLDRSEAVGNVIGIVLLAEAVELGGTVIGASAGAIGAGAAIGRGAIKGAAKRGAGMGAAIGRSAGMGAVAGAAGGQVAHELRKEGIPEDLVGTGALGATFASLLAPLGLAKFAKGVNAETIQKPIAWFARSKWGSQAVGWAISEGAKAAARVRNLQGRGREE